MLKITVLGNNGPFAGHDKACSGYLLQTENTNILVDCGNGVLANLQKHCKLQDIDAIILSHLHSDHIGDMGILKFAITVSRVRPGETPLASIPVYCPQNPKKEFESLDKEAFIKNIISDNMSIKIGDISVVFGLMEHPYENYACRFTCGQNSIVYSGDTAYIEKLADFAKAADILIGDAGFTKAHDKGNKLVHMTAEQNALIAKKAGVKKLILSHFWPYDYTNVHLSEAKEIFKNVEISEIGKVYNV